MESNNTATNPRRQFLGTIASRVAAIGISSVIAPMSGQAQGKFLHGPDDPDAWFKQIKEQTQDCL